MALLTNVLYELSLLNMMYKKYNPVMVDMLPNIDIKIAKYIGTINPTKAILTTIKPKNSCVVADSK